MRNFTFLYLLLLSASTAFAQPAEKIWFDKADSVYGYYVTIAPSAPRIQGALVLLDGYGGNADGFFADTKLQNVAYANEILTVCIPTGMRLYADSSMLALMNRILAEVVAKYQLRKDQFAIGGFSSGGTLAVRYAELCHEKPAQYAVLPKVVFDIDSPLDLAGLYKSAQRELKRDYKGWWLGESQMIIDRFNKELGDINGDLKGYRQVSPFQTGLSTPGNEQWLKNTAVRTYHDIDVDWYIKNRRRSLYETNILNASDFITQLTLEGSTQAEFISSKIQGRRSNGQRHPHSWNIADEIDLIQWLKEKLHFYPDHIEKPYNYKAPAGWSPEMILFPLDFAPTIPYKGFEDLRFAPGWGDPNSDEKWQYTFLWWLDGRYTFTEKTLAHDIEAYFTGLTRQRAIADKLDMNAWTPAKAQVQKIATTSGDTDTYTATVHIFDSQVTKKPGVLYIKIHLKKRSDKNRAIVLFEVAANPFISAVWKESDMINNDLNEPE